MELELIVSPIDDEEELEVAFPLMRLPPYKFAFTLCSPIDDFK